MGRAIRAEAVLAVAALCLLAAAARGASAARPAAVDAAGNQIDFEPSTKGSFQTRSLLESAPEDKKLWNASFNGNATQVQEALDEGADIEVRLGPFGETPLTVASLRGHLDVVQVLIAAGADVNASDDESASPLFVAASSGHLDVVLVLIEAGADVEGARAQGGEKPLFRAAEQGHLDVVEALVRAGADVNGTTLSGATPLIIAAEKGEAGVVDALLAAGAHPGQDDDFGDTALHAASLTLGPDSESIASALIEAGADVNAKTEDGGTPIFWAAEFGNVGTARLLVGAGAEVAVADEEGDTPLGRVCACEMYEGMSEFVQCPPGGCDQPGTRGELEELLGG